MYIINDILKKFACKLQTIFFIIFLIEIKIKSLDIGDFQM